MVAGGNGGTADGGSGGDVYVLSDDVCECRANIDASGGNTVDGLGGSGGYVEIAGRATTCHGNINSSGGNSTNGTGGNGDDIEVYGSDRPTDASGSVDVAEGSGGTEAFPGDFWLDGILVDLDDGTGSILPE